MPTKTFIIKHNLGPLIQNMLQTNKEVKYVAYNRPNLTIEDTLIEIETRKIDPKIIFEETIYKFVEIYKNLKIDQVN